MEHIPAFDDKGSLSTNYKESVLLNCCTKL